METRSAKRKRLLNLEPSCKIHDDAADRISDLPNDIVHHVFSFLPIKSVAQTCVLSKRWKNLWYSFPDLDFTTVYPSNNAVAAATSSTVCRRVRPHVVSGRFDYATQIQTLLDKHSDIRVLRFRAFMTFSGLSSLIRQAVKHNVQELDFEVSTCDYFNFPRSVIHSCTLRALRVKSRHPGFRLPPLEIMKDGFRSLTTLSLSRLVLQDHPSLTNLFTHSSFPMLKKLHLESCFGLKHLKIESPTLEDLTLESCFQMQSLEIFVLKLKKLKVTSCFNPQSVRTRVRIEAPMLEIIWWSYNVVTEECVIQSFTCLHEASVDFFLRFDLRLSADQIKSVWNFLNAISSCHSLTLESQCIEIISKNELFGGVALCPFNHVKSLEMSTVLSKHNNPGLARLFRNSPSIHKMIIKIINAPELRRGVSALDHACRHFCINVTLLDYVQDWDKDLWQSSSSGEEEQYWESQTESLMPFLHNLKVVKIHGFTECVNDVSLVQFLLKHGKVLQEVFLRTCLTKPRDFILREKIRSQIMDFSRASSDVSIVFH